MSRLVAALIIFLFADFGTLTAAEAVRVRAAAHDEPGKEAYGRIVFEWPSVVDYKATVEAGNLVVRFAEPFEGRLDVITRYLGDYVTAANVEDQGRTLSFPLKSSFRLKSYADGTTVVLDLARASAVPAKTEAQPAPAKPPSAKSETPPAPAAGVALLPVRVGDHEGFGRLVFDWTRNVDYTVADEGNRATIHFNQPAKLDIAALTEHLPKIITAAEIGTDGGGLTLNLTIADNARVRHFRSGTRIVLDVLDPAGAARSTASRPQDGAAEPGEQKPLVPTKQAASAAPQPAATGTSAKAVAPETAKPAPNATTPTAKPGSPAAAPPANLLARQAAESRPAAPDIATAASEPSLDEVLAAIPGMAQSRAAAPSAKRPATPASSASPVSPAPPAAARVAAAPALVASPRVTAPPSNVAALGRVVVQPLGTVNELTGLRLSLPVDAGGAVYERSGYLWVMLDRRAPVDLAGVWPRNAPKPQLVGTAATPDATLVRWRLPEGKYPGLRRDGNDWMIEVLDAAPRPPTDIKPDMLLAAEGGPRIVLRGASFGAVRDIRDPEVGDHIWVVPMAAPGYGTASDRRLAELQMVATLQGLVIDPSTDEITVRNVPTGIEITTPGGLHLSDNIAAASSTGRKPGSPAGAQGGSAGQTPIPALATRSDGLFNFDVWGAGRRNFFDRKRELQRTVIDAPLTARNAARLALAQFFFAHGYAADTLGILQVIEEDDATTAKDPAFRALRGASRYLVGDYAAASPDLFDGSLDAERETALWRGALLASQNDWIAASRYFAQADKALRSYPMELRLRFGLLAAQAAFMIGDSGLAKFQLDGLARLNPPRVWMDQIDYLQGKVLEKAYDVDAASAAWERTMGGLHRPSKVKARFARTEMLLGAKRMTPAEAIVELEKLRFGWRGDDIELAVLKRLGELYIQVADYRNGLQTLRDAVTYFPKSNDAPAIDGQMRSAFAALYIGGEADKLPPLTALSLYDDFHDLAPAGDAGDVVASKLVDRLVGVELLDRAIDVLKQQVDTRLKGAALAEGVNRLGLIHLLSRQPEEALTVLSGRVPPEATPTAVAQRRQLKARALGELTRYKDALALLDGDNSQDADRLRAEIGWRTQNWPLAAYAFARLVPEASKTLSDTDRQTVLRLAIAQALKNDSAALKDIRKIYGAGMAESAFKESFDLVTAPGEGPAVDLRAITRQVAEVDQFRAFMTSYRDKLLTRRDNAGKPVTSATPSSGAQTAATN